MKLLWHLAKKDFRRAIIPATLMACATGGQIALGFFLRAHQDAPLDELHALEVHARQFLLLQWIASFLFTGALVAEDSVAGSRSFWITRPIPAAVLLRAKLVVVAAVFWLLPLAIMLPWWIANGFGVPEVALASAELVGLQMFVTLAAFFVASLTDGWTRFLAYSLVLAMAAAAWLALDALAGLSPKTMATSHLLARSRSVLFFAIVVLTAVVVVIAQYRTRRTFRSCALAGAGTGVALAVLLVWPWTLPGLRDADAADRALRKAFLVDPRQATSSEAEATFPVAIDIERVALGEVVNPNSTLMKPWVPLEVTLTVSGVPDGFSLQSFVTSCVVTWRDGQQTKLGAAGLSAVENPAQWSGLPVSSLARRRLVAIARVDVETAERLRREKPFAAFSARLVLRPVAAIAETPLRVGATFGAPWSTLRLVSAPRPANGRRMPMVFTDATPRLSLGDLLEAARHYSLEASLPRSFVVLGPDESRAYRGVSGSPLSTLNVGMVAFHRRDAMLTSLAQKFPDRFSKEIPPSADWFERGRLFAVSYGESAVVERTVKIDALPIAEATTASLAIEASR